MRKKTFPFLVLTVLVQCVAPVVQSASSVEVDATAVVRLVIDGDTFDTFSGDRIRLADINAPEKGESGYYDAKDFLIGLVHNMSVSLDIDDVYKTDKNGRLVCVVYVGYNSTHFVNVNKALLVNGHAAIWNFDNEFNPYAWNLYCLKQEKPESPFSDIQPEWVITAIVVVVAVIVGTELVLYRKGKAPKKRSSRLIR